MAGAHGRRMSQLERQRVIYSGEVQGVGVRYTARQLARAEGVAGHVCNLSDGKVELVVEGTPAAVARVLTAVASEMAGYIENTLVERLPPVGQSGFEILF